MRLPQALGAFLSAAVLDFFWGRLLTARERGQRGPALLWNAALHLAATFGVWLVVDDRGLVVPATLGGTLGLWLSMTLEPPKEKGP